MSRGLNPCPKCKSTNLIHEPVDLAASGTGWSVVCEDCGHEGPTCLRVGSADFWWNQEAEGSMNEDVELAEDPAEDVW